MPNSNKKPKKNADVVECTLEKDAAGPEQICKVDVENLFTDPCRNESNYGWDKGTPCIAIKMNKVRRSSSAR